jgi:hypothetical protein
LGELAAVAKHARGERQPAAQGLQGGRGAEFLREAERRAAEHDDEDDRRVDPFAQEERKGGGDDQDQYQRAGELAEQQAGGAAQRVFLTESGDRDRLVG